jgi:hypothetical protein
MNAMSVAIRPGEASPDSVQPPTTAVRPTDTKSGDAVSEHDQRHQHDKERREEHREEVRREKKDEERREDAEQGLTPTWPRWILVVGLVTLLAVLVWTLLP